MLSKTRGTPVYSSAPGVIPETVARPLGHGSPAPTDPALATAQQPAPPRPPASAQRPTTGDGQAQAATARETRRDRSRRKAHRSRLHGYAILTVALVAFLVALAASNTAQVKVNWVFGSSAVALVWLVLFAAILGWALGLVATAAFHWRTRAPRRGDGPS
jgi:uncharacterized integral membrane protein